MPFAPGQTANPHGRNLEKVAAENLRMAVLDQIRNGRHKGKTKLRRICEVIAQNAMKGEPWACGLVFDRIDGKPMQTIDQSITYEAGAVFVDLLRELNEARQGKLIEHSTEDRPRTNGSVEPVRD